jgi:uncharacterized protein (TIGR02391 family)
LEKKMSFRKDCGPCEGKGYYGLVSKDTCVVCHGIGIILFEGQSSEYKTCGPCEGKGHYGLVAKETCKVCNGLGLVSLNTAQTISLSKDIDQTLWKLIHPKIVSVARSRFESDHFADSVEAALKAINSAVKAKVKSITGSEYDGADLMNRAFSARNPIIQLDDLTTDTGKNIQLGYMQLYSGAMTGIRNPKAHDNIVIDKRRAIHLLFLASLLMYKLEEVS